jgi:hypothetical protein
VPGCLNPPPAALSDVAARYRRKNALFAETGRLLMKIDQ